ncbi:YbaK/EbsC family protein [Halolamina salifodinae]|uniref:Prolyl-tRNA editing enzyme YbaK/EbsC (Cys-tRNA(Pro) deacylase) n=1 Tax=Halolamina salifodinae TaxID=1202767 RepID=A0A8T4GVT6_9EURY|nr:YbaK/EbsC family protein [Halolamina salifodinae]MBP1987117.1 prolyl-tRNA editing enzyme YbaK/EbsC (Cys-tRNA(Pro) deacylase) [Halolamina salifodinae]
MHGRVAEFADIAEERYGLSIDPVEFPEEGTPTAADAAAAVGCDIAQIVNSLVLSVDGDPVLCLTSGAERVDEAALAAWAGVDESAVSMADPEDVREATGWAIGGVPPICHETDLPTLLDPALRESETVWAAAGTPTSMWEIEPARLRDTAGAEVVPFTE